MSGDGLAAVMRWLERRVTSGDFFIAAALITMAPLFFSNDYWLAPKLFVRVFIPASVLLWLSFRFHSRGWPTLEISVRFVFAFSVIIAAVVVYLASMNLSSWRQPGAILRDVDQQWLYAGLILFFMIGFACAVSMWDDFLPRFVTAFSTLVAASALFNIIVYLSALPVSNVAGSRLVNTLGMPGYTNSTNISVTYAILFVASVAIIMNGNRSKLIRLWLAPVALILFSGVLLTQSRSAYGAVIVGLLLVLWTAPRAFRRAGLLSLVAGMILGAVVLLFPQTKTVISARGASYRPEIWSVYAGKAVQNPLLGYGGLSDIGIRIHGDGDGDVDIDQPHNLVLSAQIRGGIFCALAIITILLGSLYWSVRFLRLRAEVIPLAMVATLATAGMFDYNLLITPITWPWVTFWLPFAICAGAEIAVKRSRMSPA